MHLIDSGFCPAFFRYHSLDLFAEGFDIFGMGKETIQYSCNRLKVNNDQECITECEVLLACDVVWIAAKFTVSNRRARPSRDLSTPRASLMSHMSKSFCDPAIQRE